MQRWLAAGLLAGLILVGSIVDGAVLSAGNPTDTLDATLLGIGVDKWIHTGGYAALTLTLAAAFPARDLPTLGLTIAIALGFGAGIEGIQLLRPARTGSVLDFLANGSGVALGALCWAIAGRSRPDSCP